MSDLVARLRDADTTRRIGESYADTHERRQRDRDEAAAEIERLRALVKEAYMEGHHTSGRWSVGQDDRHWQTSLSRAALAEEKLND